MTAKSEYFDVLNSPCDFLDDIQREWLRPSNRFQRLVRRALYVANWSVMRMYFNFRADGAENLPSDQPFILAPNHSSSLDALVISAAVSYEKLCQMRWAARKRMVLANRLLKTVNRIAGTVPVDQNLSALAVAGAVLHQGESLVWFPEGTRSRDGELKEFKLGIGMLLQQCDVLVVPAYISGAFEAMPPHRKLPRPGKIDVRFGAAMRFDQADPQTSQTGQEDVRRITHKLRARVAELAAIARTEDLHSESKST